MMDHTHPYFRDVKELLNMQTENVLPDYTMAREWKAARERANAMLQQHTEELRQLIAQMCTFTHQTSVEMVMYVQRRSEALRWLIQAIEQEVQRLDKAYREAAQREQFLRDQAVLTAV